MIVPDDRYDFSLVVACYGDAPHLFANLQILARIFARTTLRTEFILVEDASPLDDAAEVRRCIEFMRNGPVAVSAIHHATNRGRGRSVQDGFEAARGTVVGYIDIDLEHSPDALLPMVLDCLEGVADAVVGSRVLGAGAASAARRFLSAGYRRMVHALLPLGVADSEAGIKVFRRRPLLAVLPLMKDEAWFWDTELVYRAGRAGMRLKSREVVFRKDPGKKSTVRVVRDSFVYFRSLLRFVRAERRYRPVQAVSRPILVHDAAEPHRAAPPPTPAEGFARRQPR